MEKIIARQISRLHQENEALEAFQGEMQETLLEKYGESFTETIFSCIDQRIGENEELIAFLASKK